MTMSQQAPPTPVDSTQLSPTDRLLVALAAAGPVYVLVAAAQVATRDGFDIRRHAVSLLSNGSLGWIQIANFVLVGLLVVAGAVGLRRVLTEGLGSVWIPRLLVGYGVGLVASGAFVADPADGFPLGTPAGMPQNVSLSGVLHLASGGVAFACLIAACLAVGRRASRAGDLGWSRFSWFTGLFFLVAFGLVASGGGVPLANVLLTVAVVMSWIWTTLLTSRERSGPTPGAGPRGRAAGRRGEGIA
jgi:hypothetical protein